MTDKSEWLTNTYNQYLDVCPHCNAKAVLHIAFGERYGVFCTAHGCGAMMLYTGDKDIIALTQVRTLVKKWNMRNGKDGKYPKGFKEVETNKGKVREDNENG